MNLIKQIHEATYAGKGETGKYIILVQFPDKPEQFAHQSSDTVHVTVTSDQHEATKFPTFQDARWIANFLLEQIANEYHDRYEADADVHVSTNTGGDFRSGREAAWVTYWSDRPAKKLVHVSIEKL